MKLILSIALCLSCIAYSISAASISGGFEVNNKGVEGSAAVNHKVGGVNVGAGVQGKSQGEINAEIGAGKNGHSASVNYNENPGGKSLGATGTINIHQSDTSKIDATASHTKIQQNNGFKFEENSGSITYADKNGNKADVSLSHIPGVKDTFSQSASVNVLNSGNHNVQLDAHRTEVKYNNGPRIESFGGKATYENANGHGAFVSANHVKDPYGHSTDIKAAGKANLFTSNDKSTRLDLTAGAQQSRNPIGVQTQGVAGLQLEVRMPPRPPPIKPAPFIPPPVRPPPPKPAPVKPPPPPPKKFDRYDPKNSPFYYEGCNLCCWGSKLWSNTCATPDDYD